MSRVRRPVAGAAAAAATTAAVLVLATGTAAAGTGAFAGPAENEQIPTPVVITGAVDLRTDVESMTLTVVPDGGDGRGGATITVRCSAPPDGFRCDRGHAEFSWAPALVRNGPYVVSGAATGAADLIGQHDGADLPGRHFGLAVPAAAPTGVRALVDGSSRRVTVVWSANHEPDVVGYRVLRRLGSGPWTPMVDVDAGDPRTWTDTTTSPGGEFAYQVVAYRPDGTGQSVVPSPSSRSATAKVSPPASATTAPSASGRDGSTTTTAAPASGGPSASPDVVPAPTGVDLSGFGALRDGPPRATPTPAPTPSKAAAQPDTGFEETLPYHPGDGSPAATAGPGAAAPGTLAGGDDGLANRRALLSAVAGALVLFLASMHVRWLLRRLPATVP